MWLILMFSCNFGWSCGADDLGHDIVANMLERTGSINCGDQ